jgi:large subunit ribosomal protein L24
MARDYKIKGDEPRPRLRYMDVRAGDTVEVIAGRDKGKRGVVDRTLPREGKVVVKGVNMLKRHSRAGVRKGSTTAIQGGVIDFPAPLNSSNVQIVCSSCDRPTRVRHEILASGRKGLVCARCGEIYEQAVAT